MGKQYNKVEKKTRRKAYLKRKIEAAKTARISRPKKKLVPVKKAEAAPAAVAAAAE